MARDVKDNKKDFNKYMGNKRKIRKNVGLLLKETGDLATKDTQKAFFASVFTVKRSLQKSQVPNTKEKGWRKEKEEVVEDKVREY